MRSGSDTVAGWIAAASSGITVMLFGYMMRAFRRFMNQHDYLMKGMEFLLDQQPTRRKLIRQHNKLWRERMAGKKKA